MGNEQHISQLCIIIPNNIVNAIRQPINALSTIVHSERFDKAVNYAALGLTIASVVAGNPQGMDKGGQLVSSLEADLPILEKQAPVLEKEAAALEKHVPGCRKSAHPN